MMISTPTTRRAAIAGGLVSSVAVALGVATARATEHGEPAVDIAGLVRFLRLDNDCIVAVHQDRQRLADYLDGKAELPAPIKVTYELQPTDVPGLLAMAPVRNQIGPALPVAQVRRA